VTRELLVSSLSKIDSPLKYFRDEIDKLLTSEQRNIVVNILAAEHGVNVNEVYDRDFMSVKNTQAVKESVITVPQEQRIPDPKDSESAQKHTLKSKLVSETIADGDILKIPEELLEEAYVSLLARARDRKTVETVLKRGFQFNFKEKQLVIPQKFLTQDDTIASIILSCARMISFSVVVYNDKDLNVNIRPGHDDFFLGLLYCLGEPKNTKLSHTKEGRELAYAIGMSLRLKGEINRCNCLGALRPNNFFFANNPSEMVIVNKKKITTPYGVKNAFLAPFESTVAGTIFYKIISQTLTYVGVSDMSLEQTDLLILSNILSFDDVVRKNWIEVWSERKGSKQPTILQVRKATFPSRNALLLNEELEVFKTYTSPFFSSVEDLRKDFHSLLFTHGYNDFMTMVSKRFNTRHIILQNIASVTTKRLQAVRKSSGKAELKKKDVTRELLVSSLSKIDSPLKYFRDEIDKLLTSEQRNIVVNILAAEHGVNVNEVYDLLLSRVAKEYVKQGVYNENKKVEKTVEPKADERIIQCYERYYRGIVSCKRSTSLIINYMNKISSAVTPDYRGYLYKRLYNLCEPFRTKFVQTSSHDFEASLIMVKSLQNTVSYLDNVNNTVDIPRISRIDEFCRDFKDKYQETTRNNTLPKTQDESLQAYIKKTLETLKSAGFL
jgi:hypothetical protein